ncbi:BrnT family toxin [Acidisoma cladoniae]|uniref:BrnT family toxin n=1 Tax=Acidisoma cladoniae TaxID=3040935 RepID=UPI00254A3617|nr:BrnT family toxin [Acidisoma sp. PAMC 29798]
MDWFYKFVVTRAVNVRVEWDPVKADQNLRKHRVSFALAMRVFFDPLALVEQDRVEGGEERWQTLGMVDGVTLLLVAHTMLDGGAIEVIRIISARRAEPKERRNYEQAQR